MKCFSLIIGCIFFSFYTKVSSVDTITIYSTSMHKDIKCGVIKPDTYKSKNSFFPTVYLLHGYSGGFDN